MHFTLGNIFVRYAVNGEPDEVKRGNTVSLPTSLTKNKHHPSLIHNCGQLRLASRYGEASESRHPLARHEASLLAAHLVAISDQYLN